MSAAPRTPQDVLLQLEEVEARLSGAKGHVDPEHVQQLFEARAQLVSELNAFRPNNLDDPAQALERLRAMSPIGMPMGLQHAGGGNPPDILNTPLSPEQAEDFERAFVEDARRLAGSDAALHAEGTFAAMRAADDKATAAPGDSLARKAQADAAERNFQSEISAARAEHGVAAESPPK